MDLYNAEVASRVTESARFILAGIINEMRAKANNNPEMIKTSTLELFADDLDSLYTKLPR